MPKAKHELADICSDCAAKYCSECGIRLTDEVIETAKREREKKLTKAKRKSAAAVKSFACLS